MLLFSLQLSTSCALIDAARDIDDAQDSAPDLDMSADATDATLPDADMSPHDMPTDQSDDLSQDMSSDMDSSPDMDEDMVVTPTGLPLPNHRGRSRAHLRALGPVALLLGLP